MDSDPDPVILITTTLSDEQEALLRSAAPGARIVREADLAADPRLVGEIEVCYPRLPPALWKMARKLRWLQSTLAGMDSLLALPEVAPASRRDSRTCTSTPTASPSTSGA